MITFKEVSSLGRGQHTKVMKAGRAIGWIAKPKDGKWRYYEPVTNELNPTLIEDDLKHLKEKIKARK